RRPAIAEEPRGFRERADYVQNRNGLRSLLDWPDLAQSFIAQVLKELVFELARAFVCTEDFRLHLLELGCDEPFAANGCLLALVMRGHIREIRFCHLDEIAEHGVVTHLERLDSRSGDLALL